MSIAWSVDIGYQIRLREQGATIGWLMPACFAEKLTLRICEESSIQIATHGESALERCRDAIYLA